MNGITSSKMSLIWYSFSMFSVDSLSRLIAFATPPTARFWMFGVLLPRMVTILFTFRWYSRACR